MRVFPECVYLRLEPSANLINLQTQKVRSVPAVEIHWKQGRKWEHRTFVAPDEDPTLAAALRQVADLVETFPDLDAALATLTRP